MENTEQQVYFGNFAAPDWGGRAGKAQLEAEFNVRLGSDITVLFAFYEYENYSGSAYVLFEQLGKLYEVAGSHCSCYGLDGQWEPTETTAEGARLTNNKSMYYVPDSFAHEALADIIDRYEESRKDKTAP